jgi:hypothetical protein
MLGDEVWSGWSDHEIGRRCHVGHDMVRRLKSSLALNASEDRTFKTKHGSTADKWSAWPDLNRRPPAPQAGALTRLRYTPLNEVVAGFTPAID